MTGFQRKPRSFKSPMALQADDPVNGSPGARELAAGFRRSSSDLGGGAWGHQPRGPSKVPAASSASLDFHRLPTAELPGPSHTTRPQTCHRPKLKLSPAHYEGPGSVSGELYLDKEQIEAAAP